MVDNSAVDNSAETWSDIGILNEDTSGEKVAMFRLVLTGFMTPSVFLNQMTMYRVASGKGLLFYQRENTWFCTAVPQGRIVDISPNVPHFFYSPYGRMKIEVTGSAALLTLRQPVPDPVNFILSGVVKKVFEDGTILCQTVIGVTPPQRTKRSYQVGQGINLQVDFSRDALLEKAQPKTASS